MEGNGYSEKMYSNAMFGLPQNPQTQLQKMIPSTQQQHLQYLDNQTQLTMKQPTNYLSSYPNPNPNPNPNSNPSLKSKSQLTNSDEDEPGCGNDMENNSIDGKRKTGGSNISPWQRMKWTDNMVRLLIMAVYYIGDEAGNDAGPDKKKPGPAGSTGLLQKKGKWKSVSRAMMEKGFYVSPQQCEDKFNDLNKRYKRVNDILGKGTACKVVENQSLLETMDLTPKMKEEVRKLLNSKHLFFREMCAYHNSCGHGVGTTAHTEGDPNPGQVNPVQSNLVQSNPVHLEQQSCSHLGAMNGGHKMDDVDDDDDDDDDFDDDDYDDDDDHDNDDGGRPRKRGRIVGGNNNNINNEALQQLSGEIINVLQDVGRNAWEKRQWIKIQLYQLEEERLKFNSQKLELEKQRLKWMRYSDKKERQLEELKLANEMKMLENDRMILLVKQKEAEIIHERSANGVANDFGQKT